MQTLDKTKVRDNNKEELLEQFRCPHCNALLMEQGILFGKIRIKCYRCNSFVVKSFDAVI